MSDDFDAQDWLGPVMATDRGFPYLEFKDLYDAECSLQISSRADDEAIWLGINDAKPKIMWKDAESHGVKTNAKCGWVPYPLPEAVSLNTRMHLNKEQAQALIEVLQRWVDSGDLIV